MREARELKIAAPLGFSVSNEQNAGQRGGVKLPAALMFLLLPAVAAGATEAASAPPRLAVVISIDQARGDLIERFRAYYGTGGFNRLLAAGAVYEECHHRHAATTTANGHATLLTGVHADVHGIIGNEWLAGETLEKVGAVSDSAKRVIGASRAASTSADVKAGASPRRLLAPTVGDQLKLRYGPSARVISISGKDRSAILMGGRLADAAYWWEAGRFVSSTYYREEMPAWAEDFNKQGRVEKDFGREWTRLLDVRHYDEMQGPDDGQGEEKPHGFDTTFPHRIDGGKKEITNAFYEAYRVSPFISDLTVDFAKLAILSEGLGRDSVPDLLCLGFSQPDFCGHPYGPDSHEIMDSFVRLDRSIEQLLALLDAEVGKDKYTIVVSADHGCASLPERAQQFQRDVLGGRFNSGAALRSVEAALTAEFGPLSDGGRWGVRDAWAYRFRAAALAEKNLPVAKAAEVVKSAFARHPQVAAAYTRQELLAQPAEGGDILALVRRSFHAERGGDVVFVLKPYVVDRSGGSTHGTPYRYDTHVPLIWFGVGVPPGRHVKRIGVEQMAPTLCGLLGAEAPASTGERLF